MNEVNNIGKLFYKEYYNEVDWEKVLVDGDKKEKDKSLKINHTIKKSPLCEIARPIEGVFFKKAQVQYPGIVTGVGLEHNVAITDGYKLGMHFDYTHGMPILYGSSVKGVLKTYFKEFFLKRNPDRTSDADKLAELIFDGKNPKYEQNKTEESKYIPLYERDVFFDAVVTDSYNGRFLEDDSITPHTDGALKNPKPIKMLKIAAGCKMEFRFKLNTHQIGENKYTPEIKWKVFKEILETVGVGAKTNVGYGQVKFIDKKGDASAG